MSRIQKYKTLRRRIEGLQKEKMLYTFCLTNIGKTFWAREVCQKLGYEKTIHFGYDSLQHSRLGKYINITPTSKGKKRYIQVKDIIWIPTDLYKNVKVDQYRYNISHATLLGFNWISKSQIPFWLLSEFGGKVDPYDFIDVIDKNVKELYEKINDLKKGKKDGI